MECSAEPTTTLLICMLLAPRPACAGLEPAKDVGRAFPGDCTGAREAAVRGEPLLQAAALDFGLPESGFEVPDLLLVVHARGGIGQVPDYDVQVKGGRGPFTQVQLGFWPPEVMQAQGVAGDPPFAAGAAR